MKIDAEHPNSCYWELTRRCRLACLHCRTGSRRAGEELELHEMMNIADQLIALKPKHVVLTGGEPTEYRGWEIIARHLTDGGIKVRLFISGFQFDEAILEKALKAGIDRFAVSLDGPEEVHDYLRPPSKNIESTHAHALRTLKMIIAAGKKNRAVTQVNCHNVDHLPAIYRQVVELGVQRWQVHLCQMTGRAGVKRNELMTHPRDLEKIVRVLLTAAQEKKINAPLHCTIGYMTEEEPLLRGRQTKGCAVWMGCKAGRRTLAITPNGSVKGCTTLPDEFITASVRERSLSDIWTDDRLFPYTRQWSAEMLGGRCMECALAATCRAGCIAVAYSATGSIGANPYCLRLVRSS